jgi:transcriptional regulator with XRE-family HTH domain
MDYISYRNCFSIRSGPRPLGSEGDDGCGEDLVETKGDLRRTAIWDVMHKNIAQGYTKLRNRARLFVVDTKIAEFAEKLGKRIVQLRKEQDFAQERLATLARMNKGYLSSVESGQRVPSVGMLVKLSKVLQVQLFDLFVFPDGGPLDRMWEEIRKGGSPAVDALRSQYGIDSPGAPDRAVQRPAPRAGRSVKTVAAATKKAAKTHVKAASAKAGARGKKAAVGKPSARRKSR